MAQHRRDLADGYTVGAQPWRIALHAPMKLVE
jgi:hypothetical protein